jgi:hypothetical protein
MEVNFTSQNLGKKVKEAEIIESFHIYEYEKTLILERLEKAVEKLKEARLEIRKAVQAVIRMKEGGDDIANQALTAVVETFSGEGNNWSLPAYTKAKIKNEAAQPLLLLRSYD